jgi:hypothetical protein
MVPGMPPPPPPPHPPREDRRWPTTAIARALSLKYATASGDPDQLADAVARDYYGRDVTLRFTIQVGREVNGIWSPHGKIPEGSPVRVLDCQALPEGHGLVLTVAVFSPATSELLLERLHLWEVELPAVLTGPARDRRDWRADPQYHRLSSDNPQS